MSLESPSPASSPNIVTPASAAGKRERRAPSHFGSVTSYPSDLAEQFVDFEALLSAEPPKKTSSRGPVSKTFSSKSTQTDSEIAAAATSDLLGPPFSEDEVIATPSKQPKASAKVKSTPSKVVYKEDSVAESEEAVEEDDGSAFAPSPVASEQEDLAHESESEFEGGSDVSEKKKSTPSKPKAKPVVKPSPVKSSAKTDKTKVIKKTPSKVKVDEESESEGNGTPSPTPARSNNAKTKKTPAKSTPKKFIADKLAAENTSEEEREPVTPQKAPKKTAKKAIAQETDSEVEPISKTKSKPKTAATKSSKVTKPVSKSETASESEHEAPAKKPVAKKPAAKKAATKKSAPASDNEDEASGEEPAKVKMSAPKRAKPASTSGNEDDAPRKKAKPAPKAKASKTSKARSASVVESEEDGDDESEVEKPKKKAPVKSVKAKKPKADESDASASEVEEKPAKKLNKTVKRKRSPSPEASEEDAESNGESKAKAKAKKIKKNEDGDKPAKATPGRVGTKQQAAIFAGFDVDAIKGNKQLWTSISEEVDIPESKIRRHWRESLFPDILAYLQGNKAESSKATKDFSATTRLTIASKVLEQYASANWDSIVGECSGYTATQLKRNCREGMTSSIKKFLKA